MVALGYPLPRAYRVTRPFGDTSIRSIGAHTGIDLGAPFGTPVLAAAAGVARTWWNTGGGRMVGIDHGGGVETRYAHLSRALVKTGEAVVAGQQIGIVGATGALVFGAHLHYEVLAGGKPINPAPYLGAGTVVATDPSAGHITTYPPGGCGAGYVPARIAGPLLDLPIIGATPIGSNRIEAIGRPGEAGSWNACLLAARGFRVGDDPYAPGTIPGGVIQEVTEGFGAWIVETGLPLGVNVAVVYIGARLVWSGVNRLVEAS